MTNFTDPFKEDTDKFKQLLNDDISSKSKIDDAEITEVEEVSRTLSENTFKGLPPSIFKAVKEKQDRLTLDETKKKAVAATFNNLFDDLNKKYGLNVTMDFDSFTNNLNYMIEPVNKKAMECYLSEAYGTYRVALYGQYLQAIALLSSQILDPAYLLSESMTYDQKLDTLERLYNFMNTMNDIYEKVNIPDTDIKLEKLSSDQRPTYNLNDPKVREFMENYFDENVKKLK